MEFYKVLEIEGDVIDKYAPYIREGKEIPNHDFYSFLDGWYIDFEDGAFILIDITNYPTEEGGAFVQGYLETETYTADGEELDELEDVCYSILNPDMGNIYTVELKRKGV